MRITTIVRADGALLAVCAKSGDVIEGLTMVKQTNVVDCGIIKHTLTITVEDVFTLSNPDA